MIKQKRLIAVMLVFLTISICFSLAGCSNAKLPSEEQVESDLRENGAYVAWWDYDGWHPTEGEDFSFAVTESLSKEDVAYYYVHVEGSDIYSWGSSGNIDENIVIEYEKYNEGWQFVRAEFE